MNNINSHIRFIGAEDDNIDLFEGQYPVPAGISYNSYLIDDNRLAIIDSVDRRRCSDWLAGIENALNGRKPYCLIVQHMEPDHSASIQALIRRFPDIKVITTAKAADMLANFFEDTDWSERTQIVADGDTLSLGTSTLQFITAPMVHWPEVMMTLHIEDGVLFSADAFGSFAMSSSTEAWDAEARRYYTNIVGRFGNSVQSVMKKLSTLKFSTIAPLHGPLLSDNLPHYWKLYDMWSRYEPETRGALIAYASIYGGTADAARRIATQLESAGVGEVVLFDLSRHDVSYAVAEAFRFSHMVLCSVTYDGALFPAMESFIHHLQRKNLCRRKVALVENGSWAPTAARLMTEKLSAMKDMTLLQPVITIRSRMHHSDMPQIDTLVRTIADDILNG